MHSKWYVYTLSDPETRRIFYVGKGKGNRMYMHGCSGDKSNQDKQSEISRIGFGNVLRRKVAIFSEEHAAIEYENKLLQHLDSLTNVVKYSRPRKRYVYLYRELSALLQITPEITEKGIQYALRILQYFGDAPPEYEKLVIIAIIYLESVGCKIKYAQA